MSKLMDINSWHTHGQVVSAEVAKSIGLTVIRVRPDNPGWATYWKLLLPAASRSKR